MLKTIVNSIKTQDIPRLLKVEDPVDFMAGLTDILVKEVTILAYQLNDMTIIDRFMETIDSGCRKGFFKLSEYREVISEFANKVPLSATVTKDDPEFIKWVADFDKEISKLRESDGI